MTTQTGRQHVAHRASDEVAQNAERESKDGSIRRDPMVSLWDEIERLRAENERLRVALREIVHLSRFAAGEAPEIAAQALEPRA